MAANRPWKNRVRIEFSPEKCGVPDVVHFGRYNYVRAGPGLSVHAHKQSMEFCFLVRGRQTYRVAQRYYRLAGGDVFVTFPDEPHSTGDAPEEKGILYWFIVKIPPPGKTFLGLSGREAKALRTALTSVPTRRFRSTKRAYALLDAIAGRHFAGKSPLQTVAMHNDFITLLLEVVAAAHTRNRHGGHTLAILDRITHLIEENLTEPLSVTHLAAQAGLSVPRFKVWFKEQTGVPPGEYVLRLRVEEARRRLAARDASITAISYDLGFSSSQYFATVVKRYTGRTPGQLRAVPL
jgi:AraC-like DNA-binding protein